MYLLEIVGVVTIGLVVVGAVLWIAGIVDVAFDADRFTDDGGC